MDSEQESNKRKLSPAQWRVLFLPMRFIFDPANLKQSHGVRAIGSSWKRFGLPIWKEDASPALNPKLETGAREVWRG